MWLLGYLVVLASARDAAPDGLQAGIYRPRALSRAACLLHEHADNRDHRKTAVADLLRLHLHHLLGGVAVGGDEAERVKSVVAPGRTPDARIRGYSISLV